MRYYDDTDKDPLLGNLVKDSIKSWVKGTSTEDIGFNSTVKEYRRIIRFRFVFIAICIVVIFAIAGYSVTLGPYNISIQEAYEIIWSHLTFGHYPDTAKDYIVWHTRIPRVAFAVFGGAALSVAGAVMQSILKNPLADSYTTGVSSGAGFGATLAMSTGLVVGSMAGVVSFAFVFSIIPTAVIIAISKLSNASPTTMIMAGIGVMYVFSAGTTVLMLWSDPQAMSAIYAWQVGSLSNYNVVFDNIPIILVVSLAGTLFMCLMAGRINVLATGDESAKALGIDADKLRILLLLVTGLLAAAIVSFVGIVGFVGLVSPHIVRIFIGADNRYLIPASAIFGGMLMLVADQIGRVALSTPLPVGVVMAFIGGPIFLWLILRRGKNVW
ncbi:MAG: iron ABC transporter permease [Candidatus Methanomethylophilaceae archaeon]|jgi:iron complex transport system permease protein|nr:iron ABC transporter permease [Candidatus Methanomethylophilaceae archaeon]MBR4697340.1 iron ABC transporter permease [Candidatus Methanomethylophilaceae archaeon]MBR6871207.1 iron ABC transporter permease [Candidatus Methanomethylophilaceae archaeon]